MELSILYDAGCPFCRRCREWVERQAMFVPCRFVPISSAAALSLTGGGVPGRGKELVVVANDGAFWVGGDAFLMVLWALEDHRALSIALGHAFLRPFAEHFFDGLSSGRHLLSSALRKGRGCEEGHCGTASGAYR